MSLLNVVRKRVFQAVGVCAVAFALLALLLLIFQPSTHIPRWEKSPPPPLPYNDSKLIFTTTPAIPPDLPDNLKAVERSKGLPNRRGYRNSSNFLTSIFLGKTLAVCVGSNETRDEVEDLLCLPKPKYDPRMKNPCWWENMTRPVTETPVSHVPNATVTVTANVTISSLNCLPYFHILCCSKSGTTDMFRRISMHPDIVPNFGMFGKERLWWSWGKYGRSRRGRGTPVPFYKYIKGFGILARYLEKAVADGKTKDLKRLVTLDGSPPDMWDFRGWVQLPQNRNLRQPAVLTPHLMQHLYRDPKFLILVREPAERLYTAYLFHGMGHSAQKFHEDVVEGIAMMDDCLANAQDRIECFVNASFIESMPIDLYYSCYAVYFEEWLKVFPKKHFLFLRTEDYSKNMKDSLYTIFKFLELPKPSTKDMQRMLAAPISYHTKSKDVAGSMLNETKELLTQWYRPWNQELAYLLKDKRYLWKDVHLHS